MGVVVQCQTCRGGGELVKWCPVSSRQHLQQHEHASVMSGHSHIKEVGQQGYKDASVAVTIAIVVTLPY